MAKQKTLMIIKPDGMKHQQEIIKRIKKEGFSIVLQKQKKIRTDITEKFYIHVKEKNEKIYRDLVNYMTSSEVLLLVIQGENAVSRIKYIRGDKDPEQAEKGTIRGDLGTDRKSIADAEERAVRNLVHSSGTLEEAEKEMKLVLEEIFPTI